MAQSALDERTRRELIALLPRFRRFAWGLTGSSLDDADDLVQAACERAIARIDQWEPGTRLDSWIFRIMQTIHIDQIRSEARRARHLQTVETVSEASFDGAREAENYLTLAAVRKAINTLSEEQRAVVMLVCVEGYSYKETSEILEVPIGTVTSRLTRARAALQRRVGGMSGAVDAVPG